LILELPTHKNTSKTNTIPSSHLKIIIFIQLVVEFILDTCIFHDKLAFDKNAGQSENISDSL